MRFSRSAFRRAVCLGTFAIVSLLGCARRLADRAAAAANASSVRLVRLAMELQGELDAQEDHDRWTLQLHLLLECAAMPKLHHAVHDAIADCPSEAQRRASKALSAFGEDAHRHSLNFDADRRSDRVY